MSKGVKSLIIQMFHTILVDRYNNPIATHGITRCMYTLDEYMITNIQHLYSQSDIDKIDSEFTMSYIQAHSMTLDTHHVLLFYVRNSARFILIDGQGREWEILN